MCLILLCFRSCSPNNLLLRYSYSFILRKKPNNPFNVMSQWTSTRNSTDKKSHCG